VSRLGGKLTFRANSVDSLWTRLDSRVCNRVGESRGVFALNPKRSDFHVKVRVLRGGRLLIVVPLPLVVTFAVVFVGGCRCSARRVVTILIAAPIFLL